MTKNNCNCCDERVLNLEDRVTTLTTAIDDLYEKLNAKVDKGKVISEINISDEPNRITGNKIHIDNKTMIEHGALLK